MSIASAENVLRTFKNELSVLRGYWCWFLALGIALVLLGMIALGTPLFFTITTVLIYGVLLLIGGGVQLASAVWARQWSGFFLHILAGVFYLIVGALFLERPGLAAAGFTLMLALFFAISGLTRIIVSLTQRFPNWGWVLLSGVITLWLGIFLWREWPEVSVWVIGTWVGIEMVVNGLTWVMFALALRNVPRQPDTANAVST